MSAPPVPLLAATVILLREGQGAAGPQVLLLKRHQRSDVHGGVHVFPGGKVDPVDGPAPDDVRVRRAAMREVQEECGVRLDADRLAPWSRWITPTGTALPKRFDTWFFVAELPPGQEPVADEVEAVSLLWATPADALQRYWNQEIKLAPPQLMSLAGLAGHGRIADILAAARRREPAQVMPEHIGTPEQRVVAFPGDPSHSRHERAIPGPLRLYFRNDRYEPADGLAGFGVSA